MAATIASTLATTGSMAPNRAVDRNQLNATTSTT